MGGRFSRVGYFSRGSCMRRHTSPTGYSISVFQNHHAGSIAFFDESSDHAAANPVADVIARRGHARWPSGVPGQSRLARSRWDCGDRGRRRSSRRRPVEPLKDLSAIAGEHDFEQLRLNRAGDHLHASIAEPDTKRGRIESEALGGPLAQINGQLLGLRPGNLSLGLDDRDGRCGAVCDVLEFQTDLVVFLESKPSPYAAKIDVFVAPAGCDGWRKTRGIWASIFLLLSLSQGSFFLYSFHRGAPPMNGRISTRQLRATPLCGSTTDAGGKCPKTSW